MVGLVWVAAVVVALLVPGTPAGAQGGAAVALLNATVVDVERGTLLRDHGILVRDAKIAWVGPMKNLTIPGRATRVDLRGKFVMPGLWDMHVHVGGRDGADIEALSGTTVRRS